ncbi:hypothetical protein [Psychromonas sp. psych-6C06]|nr:hypothetical protein [Psychromonas sp. psych-6C06]
MNTLKSKGIKAFIWDLGDKLSAKGMGADYQYCHLLTPVNFGLIDDGSDN